MRGVFVEISVTADESVHEVVHDFYKWLRADTDVARNCVVGFRDPAHDSGRMGAADIVNIVLSNAIAMGSFLVAYAGWRRSRPEPPERAPVLRITAGDVTVEVRDASPDTIELLRSLREARPDA
jgi:hypothetical protein